MHSRNKVDRSVLRSIGTDQSRELFEETAQETKNEEVFEDTKENSKLNSITAEFSTPMREKITGTKASAMEFKIDSVRHAGLCTDSRYPSAPKACDGKWKGNLGNGTKRKQAGSVRFVRQNSAHKFDSPESIASLADECEDMISARRPPNSSSPQKLTKTNFARLQRELEVHQAKLLELTEQGILRAKDKNLRKMIHTMSSFVFVVLLGLIMYSNYVMLAPHMNAVSMAGLLALVLNPARCRLAKLLTSSRLYLYGRLKSSILFTSCCVAVFAALLAFMSTDVLPSNHLRQLANLAATGLFVSVLFSIAVLCVDPQSLTAAILTVLVICTIFVPLFVAVAQCAKEAEITAKFFMNLLENEGELAILVDKIVNSGIYQTVQRQAVGVLGDELIPTQLRGSVSKEDVRKNLRQLAQFAGANMQAFSGEILNMVSNISNIIWAFTTFSTTLFYLLSNKSPWAWFNSLSPLSPADNVELYESVKNSTMSILLCSICIFTTHFGAMYLTLSAAHVPIVAIPSFLCGLFAVMPLWGTYAVFVPVASGLWLTENHFFAIFVCAIEITLVMFVDGRLTSYIPGDSHFVALSLVAGLYAFGPLGFLYGPLLVCLLGNVFDIYMRYLKRPLNHDMYSPNPRRKLFMD